MTLGKRRRIEGGFLGAETILSHLKESPTKKRVGIKSLSGPPARRKLCEILLIHSCKNSKHSNIIFKLVLVFKVIS